MIFSAKNEDGVPLWKLVLSGEKTVTRRTKPLPVGKTFAIQPGRGKKAVARCKVVSCMEDYHWFTTVSKGTPLDLNKEAKREGFKTWRGLWNWLASQYGHPVPALYRIEFEVVK